MAQHWTILPNGMGTIIDTGPFGNPRSETRFAWQQDVERLFEMRLVEIVESQCDEASELGDEERQWRKIRYDFVGVETDVGVEAGLVEIDSTGCPNSGFFDSLWPLHFLGSNLQ